MMMKYDVIPAKLSKSSRIRPNLTQDRRSVKRKIELKPDFYIHVKRYINPL